MTATAPRPGRARRARSQCPPSGVNESRRARRLLCNELNFVASRRFETWVEPILDWDDLREDIWLTADNEAAWFLRMNYLKYRATQLRGTLSCNDPCPPTMDRIEEMLAEALAIRNGLATVYLKLVISLAAGFANARFRVDELISEGNHVLLRALEMFDADRGFRFSTYATHAIRRNLYRHVKRAARHVSTVSPELLQAEPDQRRWTLAREQQMSRAVEQMNELIQQLDEREQFILRARHGLGDALGARTLQSIADELGVSRERVRQLEMRAASKLRRLAQPHAETLDVS